MLNSKAAAQEMPLFGADTGIQNHRRSVMTGNNKLGKPTRKNSSAKPQTPLKRSIPEFPTKVGGHHMSGSTDPARDSSLKDR
jgi:hypothetical protein